ncbi:creatininase family protein [Chloroflexota bacterium]
MKVKLYDMRWPEVKEVLAKPNVIILPVGSIEQHGRHLPVNVDSSVAIYVAETAVRKAAEEKGINAIVAPPIYYADISVHKMFPGTIGIKIDTLIRMIADVLESFLAQGFKNVVVLSGHWENRCSLESAVRLVADRHPEARLYLICSVGLGMEIEADESMIKAGKEGMGHALETETSISLVLQPENVKLEDAGKGTRKMPLSEKYIGVTGMDQSKGILFHPAPVGFEKTGIQGDPSKASRELGEKVLNSQVSNLADMLVEIVKGNS